MFSNCSREGSTAYPSIRVTVDGVDGYQQGDSQSALLDRVALEPVGDRGGLVGGDVRRTGPPERRHRTEMVAVEQRLDVVDGLRLVERADVGAGTLARLLGQRHRLDQRVDIDLAVCVTGVVGGHRDRESLSGPVSPAVSGRWDSPRFETI